MQEGRKAFSVDREGENHTNFIQVGDSERSRISEAPRTTECFPSISHVFLHLIFIDPKFRIGDSIPAVSRSAENLSPQQDDLVVHVAHGIARYRGMAMTGANAAASGMPPSCAFLAIRLVRKPR